MISHLEKLWCALYVSEGWYEMWRHYNDYTLELPEGRVYKKYALKCKAIGIVEFDRMLNKYDISLTDEGLPSIFVYWKEDVVED